MNRSAEYTTAEWMRRYDEMKAQRDRLREALESLVELGRKDTSNPKYDGYYRAARAALAEVEESDK